MPHAALDLSAALARLAARRPVFHSEADLQHDSLTESIPAAGQVLG